MLIVRWTGEKTRTATWLCDHCGAKQEQRLHENSDPRPPNEWPMFLGKACGNGATVEALCCGDDCMLAWQEAQRPKASEPAVYINQPFGATAAPNYLGPEPAEVAVQAAQRLVQAQRTGA